MRGTRRETLIIARTDAIAVEGFDRAIDRAERYREAGADMLFVEAPKATRRTRADRARARPRRAADGQHGRGRQDADAVGAAELEALGFCAGDLPRRHRARAGQDARSEYLRLARRARQHRAVPRPHARFRRAQRA